MKRIIILGATGSIGDSAIKIAERFPDRIAVVGLHAHANREKLARLAQQFNIRSTALSLNDPTALERLIKDTDADLVINGIAGSSGLTSSIWTLESGKDLALANKESMVMAGPYLRALAHKYSRRILPVDSEHAALFSLLQKRKIDEISQLIITASGGPFRNYSMEQLESVTPTQAAAHPVWKMGPKISIDSASLANKGLEVIEAMRLFDIPPDRIKTVIHPESLVHSLIRTVDGALYAQISRPDMLLPLQSAMLYPDMVYLPETALDLAGTRLTFEEPDWIRFPLLRLAYLACKKGDPYPIVFNAANEKAVEDFRLGKIKFTEISTRVARALDRSYPTFSGSPDDIWAADAAART